MSDRLSYHDLYVTTAEVPRTSIFNLPFGMEVSCTRVSGWQLWQRWTNGSKLLAGEYDKNWLILDVNGTPIVERTPDEEFEDE